MTQETAKNSDIALIEFKGTTLPVLAITLRSLDLQELTSTGSTLFGEGAFFDDDLAVLDLSQVITWPEQVEWTLIVQLLTSHGVRVLGITRANPDLTASAASAGLPLLALSAGRSSKPAPIAKKAAVSDPELDKIPASLRKKTAPETASTSAAEATKADPDEALLDNPGTLVIDRPLRSGQQVYARGGDLVILAAVNPGAEVIADGNIHVYAPLRGRALAGARGNAQARILTTVFAAELVSIAGIYRTFEDGVPAKLANQPVQVRLMQEPAISNSTGLKSRLEIDILRVD